VGALRKPSVHDASDAASVFRRVLPPAKADAIAAELLRAGLEHRPGAAIQLANAVAGYRAEAARHERFRTEQRAAGRRLRRRGRPWDALRADFEAEVLTILCDRYGIPLAETDAGPAVTILALLGPACAQPRNAFRRGREHLLSNYGLGRTVELLASLDPAFKAAPLGPGPLPSPLHELMPRPLAQNLQGLR
jgi:hypothetical protein